MIFIIFMVLIFEEREVKGKFGEEYKDYANEVPMVSFEWGCLKSLFT